MYRPAHFRQDDIAALRDVIRAFPLATLVTPGPEGVLASHLPMLLDSEPAPLGTLVGHFARANVQWKSAAGVEALVIFSGPQAYVSPSSYAAKVETGRVVPTWNYVAVHARGPVTIFTDPGRLHALVTRLTERHESPRVQPWSTADAPERFMHEQLSGIVGIEIPLRELLGKWKLSQNRPPGDRARVAADLAASPDPDARATAAVMTALPPGEA